MIDRVRGLFSRYADRHSSFLQNGFALPKHGDSPMGFVDSVSVQGNRLRYEGWTAAHSMTVSWAGGKISIRPHLVRHDVSDARGLHLETGFVFEVPLFSGPYDLTLHIGSVDIRKRLEEPGIRALKAARNRQKLPFARDLLYAMPDAIRWMTTKDAIYRARIKSRLRLDAVSQSGPMNDDLFGPSEIAHVPPAPVTIVLPVYNAFDLLPDVLRRVEEHTDLPFHLIMIEDRSTDDRVRPFLRDWAGTRSDRVTLLENDANQGFIQSVNRGLEAAAKLGTHVVLLNSDALVPRGWASRLLRPILTQNDVATVTPMSNDAEIFSVPVICERTVLSPGEGDALDRVATGFNPEILLSEAPTGVGFCMAMNHNFLARIPSLDTSFGRGYGEEVDWCQKARALGGKHIGLPGLFVEHRGGESFGSEEKRALVLKNNAIIARRYTTYDREVQDFIQADPLVTARLALAIGFVGCRAKAPVPIYLAHSLGGGAENYLQDRIKRDLEQEVSSIVLRVGGPRRFQVEVRTPEGETSGSTDNADFVRRLLAPIIQRHIVYSCGVGDPDPVKLPGFLLSLAKDDDQIDILIHDFFSVSPSYCLLDSDGW